MRRFVALLAAAGLAVALLAAGCGSDLKCGPGTHSANGACVQDNPMDCDPNTAELVDGVCQAKPGGGTCGPGTVQNPLNLEECIPDCGAGAERDPVTKKCVPSTALIEPDVTETAGDEPNNPLLDGELPIDFTLPGEGGSIILGGVISAPIDDGAGGFYADFDGWKFTTTGPTLLLVEGLPVAHIRTAFFVSPADNPGAVERVGFDADADQAARQLWIDRAGDWVIVVSDANNVNDLFHPGIFGLGSDAPVGADDSSFNYAFRVTHMASPGEVSLSPATPMIASYNDGVRFYTMNPTLGQIVEFWNVPGAYDVYPATSLYITDGAEPRNSYDVLTLARAAGQKLLYVTDYDQAWTSDLSVQYLANLVTPAPLGVITAPVTRPGDVVTVAGTSMYYTATVSAPTLFYATANPGAGPLQPLLGLYDNSMEPLGDYTPDFMLARVAPAAITEYVLRVGDAEYAGGATYAFDLNLTAIDGTTVAEAEPNDTTGAPQVVASLPAVVAGALSLDTDVDVYRVTLPAGTTTLVIQTLPGPAGATDTILTLGDAAATYINDNDDIDGAATYQSRLVETGLTGGADYLIVVEGYEAGGYYLVVMAQ